MVGSVEFTVMVIMKLTSKSFKQKLNVTTLGNNEREKSYWNLDPFPSGRVSGA